MLKRGPLAFLGAFACAAILACGVGASNAKALINPDFAAPFFYSTQSTFGFEKPIGMAIAPDGRMFVTDDAGVVWTSDGGGGRAIELFDLSDHVNLVQDRGLISVAVDKNYAFNRHIYLAYTFEDRTKAELEADSSLDERPKTQRLVRVTVPFTLPSKEKEAIQLEPEDEQVILGSYSSDPKRPGVPFSATQACPQPGDLVNGDWSVSNASDCIPSDSHEHTIDSVRVDPVDGTLWVSVGDGASGGSTLDTLSWRSQRNESYSGKLLHIGTDGKGLPGHPFCPTEEDLTKVCTKVYAKGFRNPFRFFLRPIPDGRPAVADAGWSTREEIDLAEAGKNYGWPCREGKVPTPTWSERPECEAISPSTFTEPTIDYPWIEGGVILGGVTYTGTSAPTDYPAEYKGAIFYSDYKTNQVLYIRLNEAGTGVASGYPKVFADDLAAVDWEMAPNGDLLYADLGFTSGQAQVRRISFDPDNAPPEAVADADKTFGTLPLEVTFDASQSTDSNGEELDYEWDLDGDGETDDSKEANPKRTYKDPVNAEVTLKVDDQKGGHATDTIEIYPGDLPPEPFFTSGPTTYENGTPILLSGAATDPDESLGAADLFWDVKLDHAGTHIHPLTSAKGVGSVGFETDTVHDAPSTYIVELSVEDSRGLETTTTRVLTPETSLVRIDSSPQGAPITYGGVPQTAPYEKQSTIGLVTTISATQNFNQGGSPFEFESWSDGGARIHDLVVPDHDVALTAKYRSLSGPPPPPPVDSTPASLSFSAKQGLTKGRKQSLRGTVSDESGVRKVQVALRQKRKVKGLCHWWSQGKHGFPKGASSCGKPAYMTAKLQGSGESASWTLSLGGRLPKGDYLLFFRTEDRAGNVGAGPNGSKQVPLHVK